MELASIDPLRGTIFYELDLKASAKPRFVRSDRCLACHAGDSSLRVPGLLVRSFLTDDHGRPISGYSQISHDKPLEKRWGGWYVTGTHGDMLHLGNVFGRETIEEFRTNPALRGNLTHVDQFFDTTKYLSPHSDLVAHLVLDHQVHAHNLITRVSMEYQLGLESDARQRLVRHLLFLDEAPLTAPVKGTSGYQEGFARQGKRDSQGRSLKDFELKTRLFQYLKPAGLAIINADDPTSHRLLDQLDCPTLTIAIKQAAEINGKLLERSPSEQMFMITAGNESAVVRSSIIGNQHIYNCLSAAAVGLASGIDLPTITRGLESVSRIPGRMERVDCGQPFGVWIDSSRSPRQLATAINSVHQVTEGRVWCVCSTTETQTREERRLMGRIVEKTVHQPVITKATVDQAVDFEPAHQVLDGFSRPSRAQIVPNRIRAIEWVLERCEPGDSLVITGRGERPIATVGAKKWHVSDRDVCQAWLYDQGQSLFPSEDPPIFNINDFR